MNVPRPDAAVAVRSEINVTPLVDVCLVLLIIFMLVMPMLAKSDVLLPESRTAPPIPSQQDRLNVRLHLDGSIQIEGRRVLAGDLPDALATLHATSQDRTVFLEADRRLRYQEVLRLVAALEHAGFHRLGLVSDRAQG
jgi:biopolymer transport protein TolR